MFLKHKTAYLSGPIEHDDTGFNWRVEPKNYLTSEFGMNVLDPFADPKQQFVPALREARDAKDYDCMEQIAKRFVRKDLCLVDRSDIVIAYLPHKVPTCGSHHEIILSNAAKKPTLLVCPEGKELIPAWYYGFITHRAMFGSWGDLFDYLREVDGGRHQGNRRWHYVYGLI